MLKQFADGETQHGSIKLRNHLLFQFDEFPVIGCFPYLEQVMGVLRGYGINFMIVCQSLSQLIKIYGEHHAFLDHCVVRVIFQTGKIEDAEKFSQEMGKQTVSQANISRSGKRFGVSTDNINVSDSDVGSNLINADEIMKLSSTECIVTAHGMPPYLGKKAVFYQDPRFAWKTGLPAPATLEELRMEIADLPSNRNKRKKRIIEGGIIERKGNDEESLCDDEIEAWLSVRSNRPVEGGEIDAGDHDEETEEAVNFEYETEPY
jgi:type IV secretion system protein VirD4